MSDHRAILAAYDHARAHGLPAVLATVVSTQGSTYRKAGARMMLVADGTRVGVVSGGCLEADVARRAWFLKSPGAAELVRYDTGTGEDATYEFGLGCRGVVEVLLERLETGRDAPVIAALRASVRDRRTIDFTPHAACPPLRIEPPVRLIAFGSGPDVRPVLAIARAVGWQTVVVDGRLKGGVPDADVVLDRPGGAWASGLAVDARTAAVLMTHRMADDAAYLRDVLATPAAYVGCLGPLARTEALFDLLAAGGLAVDAATRGRVHAPVGLDLGGEGPAEIALAIVAEAQAAIAGACGGRLSSRGGPIHRDAPSAAFIGCRG